MPHANSLALLAETALKTFVVLSSVLATFVVLFPVHNIGLTLLIAFFCLAAVCFYVVDLHGWLALPRPVRHVAYLSTVAIQALAALLGIMLLWMMYMGTRGKSSPLGILFILNAFVAPVGMFASVRLNMRRDYWQRASFWGGALIALPLAALLYVPDYIWVRYHEHRLATAQSQDVISSLHSLKDFPFGRRRYAMVACDKLVLRDIDNPYFMYEPGGTSFLPDYGVGEIETKLRARFGAETEMVIAEVKATFGSDIMLRCPRWRNPSSG
jgi:hypothetical protein